MPRPRHAADATIFGAFDMPMLSHAKDADGAESRATETHCYHARLRGAELPPFFSFVVCRHARYARRCW